MTFRIVLLLLLEVILDPKIFYCVLRKFEGFESGAHLGGGTPPLVIGPPADPKGPTSVLF